MEKARDLLINTRLPIRHVGEAVGCPDQNYFSRLFKNYTGFSPIEYRNHIRIERAKEFLSHPATPIKHISERCGFANSNYFCDAFKKAEGISPSEYRKQNRRIAE